MSTAATAAGAERRLRHRFRRRRLAAVDQRLHEWGDWVARQLPGLGYPSRTPEGRLMEDGMLGIASAVSRLEPPPYLGHERAAEVHRVVRDLDRTLQVVAYAHYAARVGPRGGCAALGCSRARYYRLLDDLLHYVAGRLGYGLS